MSKLSPHDRLLMIAGAIDSQAALADRPGQTAELDMLADELRDVAAQLVQPHGADHES